MSDLAAAQRELQKLGLYKGVVDGIWGPNTASGLDQLRKRNSNLGPVWSKKVDDDFIKKVKEVVKNLGSPPEAYEWLMSCMAFESAETFSPSIMNFAGSGACVDTSTRILTECGWRWHHEIDIGDLVWSVNNDTKELELTPLLGKTNKFTKELVSIKSDAIDSISSTDHRWPLLNGGQSTSEDLIDQGLSRLLTLDDCKTKQSHAGVNNKAKLAGVVCRWGHVDYGRKVIEIVLDGSMPIDLINRLTVLAIKVVGENNLTISLTKKASHWLIKGDTFTSIVEYLMPYPHSPESAEDMLHGILFESETLEQFKFTNISSDSKGYILDQILFCGAVSGNQFSVVTTSSYSCTVSKPVRSVKDIAEVRALSSSTNVEVWCPTVINGTWIARKASSVFLTSNCGLIQFMPATARGLGTTTQALSKMTALEQLEYVHAYFKPYRNRLKNIGDYYMAILWPRGVGKDDNYVLWSKDARPTTYRQNAGLDVNKDGVITRRECLSKIYAKHIFGALAKNRR